VKVFTPRVHGKYTAKDLQQMEKRKKGTFGGVKDVRPYVATDIRFTTKNGALYAFCMENTTADVLLKSLSKNSKLSTQEITSVTMLASKEKIQWKLESEALVIKKPASLPAYKVVAFSIKFKKQFNSAV